MLYKFRAKLIRDRSRFSPDFESNTSVCLIISVFCKSCKHICESEITPVLCHIENLQKSKQKQFHVQCSVHKSYKTRKWTSLCIENFEENIDPSCIYIAVLIQCRFFYAQLSLFRSIETIWEWLIVFNYNFASFLVPCTC